MALMMKRLLPTILFYMMLTACITSQQKPIANQTEYVLSAAKSSERSNDFDMLKARRAMASVPYDNLARFEPVWSSSGDVFAYQSGDTIRVRTGPTGTLEFELSIDQLARELDVDPEQLSISIEDDAQSLYLSVDDRAWVRALTRDAVPQISEPRPAPQTVRKMFPMNGYDRRETVSPDGSVFASLKGRDLAVRGVAEAAATAITDEQDPNISWFHGNDIWEASSTIWNAQGTHFIARRHDASATPGLLSLDYLSTSETVTDFRYWARAGDPLPVTTLYAVNAQTQEMVQLGQPSGPDAHLFFIEWAPHGGSVLAIRYTRDLSEQTIVSLDVETGQETLLHERSVERGWVKWPSGPQTIRHFGSDQYLLRTDVSGFFNYVVLDSSGQDVQALTDFKVDVGDVIGVDEVGGWLYFLSPTSSDRPYDQIPHRVPLEGGPVEALANQTGVYKAWLSPDGTSLIWRHSDVQRAAQTDLVTSEGDLISVLEAGDTPDTILGAPLPEETMFTSFDGTQIHAMILKPSGFDPTKTYPVIHRVYGAMQSQVRRSGFWPEGLRWPGSEYYTALNYLAQQGFVIVMMDAPGTPGRGRDFNLAYWGQWPGGIADHYAFGVRALAETRPWMDLRRVGVEGSSWGGYMALHTALEHPDLYKAASISVPEIDLLDHVHWIEWQLGSPQDNPQAYQGGALQNRMDELSSDLLIVAGTSDANVSVSNTMKLLDALAEAGEPYDLALFPGTNHPHQGRGDRYAYAAERIRVFFDEALHEADDAP